MQGLGLAEASTARTLPVVRKQEQGLVGVGGGGGRRGACPRTEGCCTEGRDRVPAGAPGGWAQRPQSL